MRKQPRITEMFGAKYYARQKSDGVWLYKGTRPTFTAYCGVLTVERFLLEYEKAT